MYKINNKHPIDQISFIEANQAYVVEASAGTGKTWTIERLFIKALLEATHPDEWDLPLAIENILVVTFTNDATSELKSRISGQLQMTLNWLIYMHNNPEQVESTITDPFTTYLFKRLAIHDYLKDITVLNRALQNFDQAAIYTIHGFCNKLLHDYQFDCGVNADFELVVSKAPLILELVNNFMHSRIITNLQFSDNIDVVIRNLELMFVEQHNELTLAEAIAAKLPKDLFIQSQNGYELKYRIDHLHSGLEALPNNELAHDPGQFRAAKAEFLACLINYLAVHYPLLPANQYQVSYDELIQKIAVALANGNILADKVFKLFPVAFVDEFQDTDSLQWQIFSRIYHLEDNYQPRGTLIVVGDPKQAIYRFRGADVDTYLTARKQIGRPLYLEHNFRSHANIMNFVNQLFYLDNQGVTVEQSFLGNGIGYQPVIANGNAGVILPAAAELRQACLKNGVEAEFYNAEVQIVAINGLTKDARNQKLLQSMTFEILALLNTEPELAGKIAILVTKNREASEIVSYLSGYGVRASELKLGNIYATDTAKSMYRLFLALSDLSDRRNFIKALGSGIFNVPLAIMQLNPMDETLNNKDLEKWQQRFFVYKQVWETQGIIALIYSLLKDIEHDGQGRIAVTRRLIANLWQLGELLNIQNQSLANHSELLFWFNRKLKSAEFGIQTDLDGNSEELVRLDNDDEQIVITTQHKAKGLEYEILFCPYFKNGIQLDGAYDFNYRRPFFGSYRHNGSMRAELITDIHLGEQIVNSDNKEAHRLNYVALTRAKSRIYIYLKQPTITRTTGKYNANQRPDKLVELFGYVTNDPTDVSHPLFNYPYFFSDDPTLAIKANANLPGVAVYNRNLLDAGDLDKLMLTLNVNRRKTVPVSMNEFTAAANLVPDYYRQSYTALTRADHSTDDYSSDYFVTEPVIPVIPVSYRYSLLNDRQLSGASFGILFHELCEKYPFSDSRLADMLHKHNIDSQDYHRQLGQMLDEAFSYKLIDDLTLGQLKDKSQHEFEFNLHIARPVSFKDDLARLIAGYYGWEHPFTLAIKSLNRIESGFLVGFIDLMFEYKGKYWVLDYKTNRLDHYDKADNSKGSGNDLIDSMADHHYYLQYLLYLVAVKRYLEQYFMLDDGSHLLGGAIYYYVRAVYLDDSEPYAGIYVDSHCRELVREIDRLLKGQGE